MKQRKIALLLFCLSAILFCFNVCFITVKVINYLQPKNDYKTNGRHDRFTEEGTELVRKCSEIGFQARSEDPIILKVSKAPYDGDVFVVHTTHTSTFLGLIVDAVHKVGPYPFNDGVKICSGTATFTETGTRVDCFDRIGTKTTRLTAFRQPDHGLRGIPV